MKAAQDIARGTRGELHIGYTQTLSAHSLPWVLRAFHPEVPGTPVKLHDLSTEEMLAGLSESRLPLAFLVRHLTVVLRGQRFKELTREPSIAYCPKNFRD